MLKLSLSHAADLWVMIFVTPWVGRILLAHNSYLYETQKKALGCFLHDLIVTYSPYTCAILQSTSLFFYLFLFYS